MSYSKERSCPFCSGLKIKYKTDDGIHWAECQTCFAEGPIGSKRSDDDEPRWEVRPTEDAAQSELAALREELADHISSKNAFAQNAIDLQKRAVAAEQRNAELEKDAARYIWLRDKSESVHPFYLSTPIWFTGVKFNQESVDRTIDAAMTKPVEAVSDACTSCDGSGEYIDAIGDWRGYCSCPAGVALKNKPTESGASEPQCCDLFPKCVCHEGADGL